MVSFLITILDTLCFTGKVSSFERGVIFSCKDHFLDSSCWSEQYHFMILFVSLICFVLFMSLYDSDICFYFFLIDTIFLAEEICLLFSYQSINCAFFVPYSTC